MSENERLRALSQQDERELPKAVAWLNKATQSVTAHQVQAMDWDDESEPVESLMTVAQHERIVASLTRPAQTAPQQGVQLADTRRSRIYLAGPMTGIADYNFPAFNAEADRLRGQGYHVENPADHGVVEGADWADYLRYDIGRLATCECIHLLPGWSQSSGAELEVSIAKALGMHILYAEGAETAPQPEQSGLYTCIGKGGSYELIGRATTAGALKVVGRFADEVIVYRDTESSALYCREPGDFRLRMARAGLSAVTAERDRLREEIAELWKQTEQKPAGWFRRLSTFGPWVECDPTEDGSKPLYAAPIAQTAPQPEQSGLSGMCHLEVIAGVEGPSLYVGNGRIGHRLAGNKPWGGGRTLHSFKVDIAELVREASALSTQGGDA